MALIFKMATSTTFSANTQPFKKMLGENESEIIFKISNDVTPAKNKWHPNN